MMADLREMVANDCPPEMPETPIPGGLYTLAVIYVHTDWETGLVDEYELGFKEWKEK